MISNENRQELIAYRFGQALETLELAGFLTDQRKLSVAANRIYYRMFYALGALALKHGFTTSKHSQLIGWFHDDVFVCGMRHSHGSIDAIVIIGSTGQALPGLMVEIRDIWIKTECFTSLAGKRNSNLHNLSANELSKQLIWL